MYRRFPWAASLLVSVPLVVVACGDDDGGTDDDNTGGVSAGRGGRGGSAGAPRGGGGSTSAGRGGTNNAGEGGKAIAGSSPGGSAGTGAGGATAGTAGTSPQGGSSAGEAGMGGTGGVPDPEGGTGGMPEGGTGGMPEGGMGGMPEGGMGGEGGSGPSGPFVNPIVSSDFSSTTGWAITSDPAGVVVRKDNANNAQSDPGYLDLWSAAAHTANISQTVTVPNGTYRVTFYRSGGAGDYSTLLVYVKGHDQSNPTLEVTRDARVEGTSNVWPMQQLMTAPFTVTSGTLEVGIRAQGGADDWSSFDDIVLEQVIAVD